MKPRIVPTVALLLSAAPVIAQQHRAIGEETTIAFAANGGIRNAMPGPAGSDHVFLQDRTQRWYRVTLTGPCFPDRSDTIVYRTRGDGRLDRFSTIGSLRYPGRTCGITSIVTSLPPPGQPGAAARVD